MKKQVTRLRFLLWYYSDTFDAHCLGCDVINELCNNGSYTINIDTLFNDCKYIPASICIDGFGDVEYHPSEVELINGDHNEKRI